MDNQVEEKVEQKYPYWAAQGSNEVAAEVWHRLDAWFNYLRSSLRLQLWNQVYYNDYYGAISVGQIIPGGQSGEQTLLKVPHLRSIATTICNAITAERPAFQCKAVNEDYDSQVQCQLGSKLLEYDVYREKRLESATHETVKHAYKYGEGFFTKLWDANDGEVVGKQPGTEEYDEDGQVVPGSGQPVWSGTLKFASHTPENVCRDFIEDDPAKIKWYAVREYCNKYDLAIRFPDRAEEIMRAPTRLESYATHPIISYIDRFTQMAWTYSDEIECWHFFHDQTPSLPEGRYMFMAGESWVVDGPLGYDRLPVYRIAVDSQPGTAFGYTINFDLQALAHAANAQVSAISTNESAFNIQSVIVAKDSNFSLSQLSTGMQLLEYDPNPSIPGAGKPEALNLLKTSPQSMEWYRSLVSDMRMVSGANSTMMGHPEPNVSSGSMAALLVAQALTFSVELQRSYIESLERAASDAIRDYQYFAKLPQLAVIAGKASAGYLKTFRGSDLIKINKVVVDIASPIFNSVPGKMQMADQLLSHNLIQSPAEYLTVLTTGRLEPLYEGEETELLNIRAENEALGRGESVPVLATDMHPLHIKQHKTIVASPSSRKDPNVTRQALEHILHHIREMKDPENKDLFRILGIPVLSDPPAPSPESQAAYEAEKQVAATPGSKDQLGAARDIYRIGGQPQPSQPVSPIGTPAQMPRMPSAPRNPATGQKAPVPPTPGNVVPFGVTPSNTTKE